MRFYRPLRRNGGTTVRRQPGCASSFRTWAVCSRRKGQKRTVLGTEGRPFSFPPFQSRAESRGFSAPGSMRKPRRTETRGKKGNAAGTSPAGDECGRSPAGHAPSLSERAELTQKFSDPVYRGYEIGTLSREEARDSKIYPVLSLYQSNGVGVSAGVGVGVDSDSANKNEVGSRAGTGVIQSPSDDKNWYGTGSDAGGGVGVTTGQEDRFSAPGIMMCI